MPNLHAKYIYTCSIQGWTYDEKLQLAKCLATFGEDIEKIQDEIPTKSHEQIVMAINYHKKVNYKILMASEEFRAEKVAELSKFVPTIRWDFTPEELQTSLAPFFTALDEVPHLEELPNPDVPGFDLDLVKIFDVVNDIVAGKPIAPDNMTAAIIKKCMYEGLENAAYMEQ